MQCWRKGIEVCGDFVEKYFCSFENNLCRHISLFISLKYLFPFIFCLSGGKTYQPALVIHNQNITEPSARREENRLNVGDNTVTVLSIIPMCIIFSQLFLISSGPEQSPL